MNKKKWLKIIATTGIWGLMYWGLCVAGAEWWMKASVYLAFFTSVLLIVIEE
jgi:hypothetical protein